MAQLAELQKSRVAALARRWDLVRLITYGFASVAALAVDAEDVADAAAVMTEKRAATKSVSSRLIVVRR